MAHKVQLSGWSDFQRLAKQGEIHWDWRTNADGDTQYDVIGRFAARWHLAANLNGIDLTGADPRTRSGYLSGLKVTLAYSALEHLEDYSIHNRRGAVNLVRLPDGDLADRLRSGLKTRKLLKSETISDAKIRARLEKWDIGTDPDVLIVARALRHMFAHGSFTPYGLAITSKAAREALDDLSSSVRNQAQTRFCDWLAGVRVADSVDTS